MSVCALQSPEGKIIPSIFQLVTGSPLGSVPAVRCLLWVFLGPHFTLVIKIPVILSWGLNLMHCGLSLASDICSDLTAKKRHILRSWELRLRQLFLRSIIQVQYCIKNVSILTVRVRQDQLAKEL